jgi:periplasmic divalent cation tolerance protein
VTDAILVLTMLPNADAAVEIAKMVVKEKLAACVNILPAARSIYRWKGQIEDTSEVLMLLKTRHEHYDRVQARLLELHPYEVPEVLAIPVEQGYYPYLEWLGRETS